MGKSKKAMDMKRGSLIALRIAHNIPKNQPDRIKIVGARIFGRQPTLPKKTGFLALALFLEFCRYVGPTRVILRQKLDLATYTAIAGKLLKNCFLGPKKCYFNLFGPSS